MKAVFNVQTGEMYYFPDDHPEQTPTGTTAIKSKPSPLPTPKPKTASLAKSKSIAKREGGPLSGAERKRLFRLRHGDSYRASHAKYMATLRAKQKTLAP